MKAVVLADRLGTELLPLTDRGCVALLPVVGRPVIEYTLDALAGIGIQEVSVIVPVDAGPFQQALGQGERWGLRLGFIESAGEAPPDEVIDPQSLRLGTPFLVLRGDMLRGVWLAGFLEQAGRRREATLHALTPAGHAGVCLCRRSVQGLVALDWELSQAYSGEYADAVQVGEVPLSRLESLRAYHKANLDVAAGRYPGLAVPGQSRALGLTGGAGSRIPPQILRQGIAWVGADCRIDARAELHQEVVIHDRVVVERYASLQQCVVLPDTYIGELVEIQNAIVRGNDLIRVDSGAVLDLTGTFLLTDLKPATLRTALANPLHQLLGLLLLLLSLPLWPLAALLAVLKQPQAPLSRTVLRSNRIDTDGRGRQRRQLCSVWSWNVPVPVLRYLPWLWAVVRGDLRLVGATPLTPEQARQRRESWERLGEQAPAGLFGPSQLGLAGDTSDTARRLGDAFYAGLRSTRRDLRYLLLAARVLFERRAWCGAKKSG